MENGKLGCLVSRREGCTRGDSGRRQSPRGALDRDAESQGTSNKVIRWRLNHIAIKYIEKQVYYKGIYTLNCQRIHDWREEGRVDASVASILLARRQLASGYILAHFLSRILAVHSNSNATSNQTSEIIFPSIEFYV